MIEKVTETIDVTNESPTNIQLFQEWKWGELTFKDSHFTGFWRDADQRAFNPEWPDEDTLPSKYAYLFGVLRFTVGNTDDFLSGWFSMYRESVSIMCNVRPFFQRFDGEILSVPVDSKRYCRHNGTMWLLATGVCRDRENAISCMHRLRTRLAAKLAPTNKYCDVNVICYCSYPSSPRALFLLCSPKNSFHSLVATFSSSSTESSANH